MVTKEEVKNAMEYRWRFRQVKTYLILWAVFAGIILVMMLGPAILNSIDGKRETLGILGAFMAVPIGLYSLAILPFAFYAGHCQWQMLRNCGRYQRYRVRLSEPQTSWSYRRSVSYRVTFRTADGYQITRDTKPLFSDGLFSCFLLSDYNNQTVEIFYDPELDQVILFRKA